RQRRGRRPDGGSQPRGGAQGRAGRARCPPPGGVPTGRSESSIGQRPGGSEAGGLQPRPGGPGGRSDCAVRGGGAPGRARSVLHEDLRAAVRADHAEERGAGSLRAGGPDALLHRARPGMGGRELQGDSAPLYAARATGHGPGGRLPRQAVQRARGQHPGRRRGALQPAAAGERHRQLRQGRAARPGEDRDRRAARPQARAGARNVRGSRGQGPMTAEASLPAPGGEAPWRPRYNPWLIAVVVALAAFMEILDTSIANVALPHMAGNLGASNDESTWVLTSYLVSNAIVLPISGWLAGAFGRKRFFATCLVLFTVSSLLCGLAPTLGSLIVSRIIQGAGGGGLQPMAQAILADVFPPQQRGL